MRGARILGAAMCVSVVTCIIMPEMPIAFGILHLLGSCVLIYAATCRFINRIPAWLGISLCVLLLILTYYLPDKRYIGIGSFRLELPLELYANGDLMIFGFLPPGKAYSDYFPLIPYIFPFFMGTFLGKYAANEKFPKFMYKQRIKPLSTLGQNAFFVYLIHQPLAYGVYYLISYFGGI